MVANRFACVAVAESVADVVGNEPRLGVAGDDANGEDAEVEGGDVSHCGLRELCVCYNHRLCCQSKGGDSKGLTDRTTLRQTGEPCGSPSEPPENWGHRRQSRISAVLHAALKSPQDLFQAVKPGHALRA